MKVVKIVARQTTASYRKPSSIQIKESYPLPPYSTVIGMIHFACGFEKYVDMEVSIQGKYYSKVNELYTRYEFKPGAYESDRHQIKINSGEKSIGVTVGPANIELLTNVELIFHICPKNEEMLETIYKGLMNPQEYLSLGRREDLLVIESVNIVEVRETILKCNKVLKYDAYIPTESLEDEDITTSATVYKINKKYSINPKTNLRFWDEQVYVKHVSEKTTVNSGTNIRIDEEEDLVYLA